MIDEMNSPTECVTSEKSIIYFCNLHRLSQNWAEVRFTTTQPLATCHRTCRNQPECSMIGGPLLIYISLNSQ